jgi:hypothetical protein
VFLTFSKKSNCSVRSADEAKLSSSFWNEKERRMETQKQ